MKRTPLKRGKPLSRSTPINPVNRKRKVKRKAEGEVYGPYHRWVSEQGCCVFTVGECYGEVKGHHLKTVGAGGKDAGNETPLCSAHHTELHQIGQDAFEWKHGVSLDAEAAYLWKRYKGGA